MATRMMSETFEDENTFLVECFNFNLKLTHVFSLVVESPNAAVGKGDKNQAGRFQAENQLMVQIVKHNRLRSKSLDHQGLRILMSTSSSLFFKGRLNNVKKNCTIGG